MKELRRSWSRPRGAHHRNVYAVRCTELAVCEEGRVGRSRQRDDYVPSGFKGYKVAHRAVPGHEFGFKLSSEDKAALIAFLKTL